MSKKNRRMVYEKLVAEGRLSQDDGALVQEFGKPSEVDMNFSAFTVAQLKKEADKKKLEYKEKSTKDELIVLLETDSKKEV